jgi:molybdopterin/thiamine biosynthesis adenylyltransferase
MRDRISKVIRLDRQNFLGENSAEVLDGRRAGIIGLGGGGSQINQQLAHLGLGGFTLIDPDKVEDTNMNRLVGATEEDVARECSKVLIAERLVRMVNPWARVTSFKDLWQNRAAHLKSCDVIFGCVDSIIEREQLEAVARRYLIPYIDIGMDVYPSDNGFSIGGQVALSMPGGPCLRCLGVVTNDGLKQEARRYGTVGGRPQVIWPNGVLASTAIGIFVKLVTPWETRPQLSILLEYDGDAQTLQPSNKLKYVDKTDCRHYGGLDGVGDPFWHFEPIATEI